jgi:hypothetical protein
MRVRRARSGPRFLWLRSRACMRWMWDNAVTLATVLMAVAAVVALVYAHLSITGSRAAERRANANELWREILSLTFENPKLSDPRIGVAKFDYVAKTRQPRAIPEIRNVRRYGAERKRGDPDCIADQGMEGISTHPAPAASRLFAVGAFPAFGLHGSIHGEVPCLRG